MFFIEKDETCYPPLISFFSFSKNFIVVVKSSKVDMKILYRSSFSKISNCLETLMPYSSTSVMTCLPGFGFKPTW